MFRRLRALDQPGASSMTTYAQPEQSSFEKVESKNKTAYPQPNRTINDFDPQGSLQSSLQENQSAMLEDHHGQRDQRDVLGLYKFLFENDLKSSKDKAVEQLESLKEKNDQNVKESEVLRLENQDLRNHIRRYRKMAKDLVDERGDGIDTDKKKVPDRQQNDEDISQEQIDK
jgi:regulator of replication initiation timing